MPDRPRLSRPSWRSPDGGRSGPHPERSAGPQRQRRMAKAGYFASRCKGPSRGPRATGRVGWPGPAENSRARHCRAGPPAVRSPSRRPGARLCPASRAIAPTGYEDIEGPTFIPSRPSPHSMKRATSCGASWVRRLPEGRQCRSVRRSSLKSPSLGDHAIASMPAASARVVRAATAASPAASSSRAM